MTRPSPARRGPAPPRRDGGIFLTLVGGLARLLLMTLLGAAGGLAFGARQAMRHVAALPPPPPKPTLGMEWQGLEPAAIWGVDLALGAAGGAVVGFLIGFVWVILQPYVRVR